MYRGVSGINIDVKGRIVVPSRFRASLTGDHACVVLTIDTDEKCLLLYPLAIWEEIEAKLATLPAFDPQSRRIQRLLIGHATETDLDSHGRILLPPLLRDYASLDKKAVMVGQGKKFELWDEDHWQQRRAVWLADESLKQSALPEELKKLPL